jgi:hypothetical protein
MCTTKLASYHYQNLSFVAAFENIIIQILYERLHNNNSLKITNKNIIETCSTIVKFVIKTLIEERKIEIDIEKKTVIIEQLDKLIDSCMCLLNFDNVLMPKSCNCAIM